jgi:hypothetical protein
LIFFGTAKIRALCNSNQIFLIFISQKTVKKISCFCDQTSRSKSGCKDKQVFDTQQINLNFFSQKNAKAFLYFFVFDRFSKSGRKDREHWLFTPNDSKK